MAEVILTLLLGDITLVLYCTSVLFLLGILASIRLVLRSRLFANEIECIQMNITWGIDRDAL